MDKSIISNAPTTRFEGVFYFTNPSDTDFSTSWNNNEYTFKAKSTSPLIIMGENLENIQAIRKLFAKKLAEREFFNSDKYNNLVEIGNNSKSGIPPSYDEEDLKEWIQKCLEPLPVVQAEVKKLESQADKVDLDDKLEPFSQGESASAKIEAKSRKSK